MNAKAKREIKPQTRAELEKLVLAYLRLADQADRNAHLAPLTDRSKSPVQQQQQQQQPQPKKREADSDDSE